jgi:hypothetical protein
MNGLYDAGASGDFGFYSIGNLQQNAPSDPSSGGC